MKTRHEMLMEDPEYRRLYAIEGLVADAAELVARLMKEQNLTKADLARRLGKSRAWITQLLSGRANMTIRTFAEVVHALGAEVTLSARAQVAEHTRMAARERVWTFYRVAIGAGREPQPESVVVRDLDLWETWRRGCLEVAREQVSSPVPPESVLPGSAARLRYA